MAESNEYSQQQINTVRVFISQHIHEMRNMVRDMVEEYNIGGSGSGGNASVANQRREARTATNQRRETERGIDRLSQFHQGLRRAEQAQQRSTRNAAARDQEEERSNDRRTGANDKFSAALRGVGQDLVAWSRQFIHSGSMGVGFTKALDDARYAMQRGADFDPLNAISMGIQVKELIDLQTEYRQVALAGVGGIEEFTSSMRSAQYDLLSRTGSMKAAAELAAHFQGVTQSVGVAYGDLTKQAIPDLVKSFKDLQDRTGITSVELMQVQRGLMQDQTIREDLMKKDAKARIQTMLHQQRMMSQYTRMGLSVEEAVDMIKKQVAAQNEDPLEMIKRSAKTRALMSMMGLGKEGAELQRIRMKGPNLSAEDSKREGELTAILSKQIGGMLGSQNISTRLMAGQILKSLGMTAKELFERDMQLAKGREASSDSIHQNQARLFADAETLGSGLIGMVDTLNAAVTSAIGMIIGGFMVKTSLVGRAIALATGSGGVGGGIANGARTAAGRGVELGRNSLSAIRSIGSNVLSVGNVVKGGLFGLAGLAGQFALDAWWDKDKVSSKGEASKRGATSGAISGAAFGASIGIFAGPVGAAVGAAAGGALGGLVGIINESRMTNEELYHARRMQNLHDAAVEEKRKAGYVDATAEALAVETVARSNELAAVAEQMVAAANKQRLSTEVGKMANSWLWTANDTSTLEDKTGMSPVMMRKVIVDQMLNDKSLYSGDTKKSASEINSMISAQQANGELDGGAIRALSKHLNDEAVKAANLATQQQAELFDKLPASIGNAVNAEQAIANGELLKIKTQSEAQTDYLKKLVEAVTANKDTIDVFSKPMTTRAQSFKSLNMGP